ncbi:MAG: hypothetical protein ING82_00205 [Roseomonas sp.]|nr:hypothetical protein [Roseomonas sp.]
MKPDPIPPSMDSIRLWSGVACPNEAARLGLADHIGLLKELGALRGTMEFEDEPSSFEAALRAEQEKEA